MSSRDWKEVVLTLRKSARAMGKNNADAALMRCRKAMEAIQFALFEERFGELPSTYIPYEKMMGKKNLGEFIPKQFQVEFNAVQSYGNLGSHYQHDSQNQPKPGLVDSALKSLDNLICWKFEMEDYELNANDLKPDLIDYIIPKRQFKKLKLNTNRATGAVESTFKQMLSGFSQQEWDKDVHLISRAIDLCPQDDDGWVVLAQIGAMMKELNPKFRIKSTGHGKLISLIRSHRDYFEWTPKRAKKGQQYRVRKT